MLMQYATGPDVPANDAIHEDEGYLRVTRSRVLTT